MGNKLDSQIISLFGSALSPVPASLLHDVELPQETKDFLLSVGLPPGGSLLLTFYHSEITVVGERPSRFLIIGDDYGTRLGLQEPTGALYSLTWRSASVVGFINTSILTMLLFLGIYMTQQPALREATDEEAVAIVERMRITFNDIDGSALANPDNWWYSILEQTKLGQL